MITPIIHGIWYDAYQILGVSIGQSLTIRNTTVSDLFISTSIAPPADLALCYPLNPGEELTIPYTSKGCWIQGKGSVEISHHGIQQSIQANLDQALLTSAIDGFKRLRVDTGQTGFFEGREFRCFKRLNIPTGQTLYAKFVAPVDFIIFLEEAVLTEGQIDITAYRQVTNDTGPWTKIDPIGRNTMSRRPTPYYESQCALYTGGSFTPGVEVGPPILIRTSNATAQQTSTPGGASRERGLAAGTYYIKMTSITNSIGCYYLEWEELPFFEV